MKGSFTSAYRDKPGKLQIAHRGTLLLDELGEMRPRMQALLLRFLENGEIQAVGSDRTKCTVDVRVIAATNGNLPELIATGRFREDLLYRLRVIHLHIPPLRSQPADIRGLATHFLARAGRPVTLQPEAWKLLEQYRWPGNVQELQNVAEQLIWLAPTVGPIEARHLPEEVRTVPSLTPSNERRRQLADELYQAIVSGGYSFWEDNPPPVSRSRHHTARPAGIGSPRSEYHARKLPVSAPVVQDSKNGLQAIPELSRSPRLRRRLPRVS